MKNKQIAILLTILMGAAPLAGCFGANEITETADEDGGFFRTGTAAIGFLCLCFSCLRASCDLLWSSNRPLKAKMEFGNI